MKKLLELFKRSKLENKVTDEEEIFEDIIEEDDNLFINYKENYIYIDFNTAKRLRKFGYDNETENCYYYTHDKVEMRGNDWTNYYINKVGKDRVDIFPAPSIISVVEWIYKIFGFVIYYVDLKSYYIYDPKNDKILSKEEFSQDCTLSFILLHGINKIFDQIEKKGDFSKIKVDWNKEYLKTFDNSSVKVLNTEIKGHGEYHVLCLVTKGEKQDAYYYNDFGKTEGSDLIYKKTDDKFIVIDR